MDFVFFAIHFCVFWSFCYIRHFFADYLYNLPKNIFITTTNINNLSNFYKKMVDYLKKALIYGHTSRISS